MQGECLSPSLFALYINDIETMMSQETSMGILIGGHNITVLKYADDLVLCATSKEGIQQGLNALHQYCLTNKSECEYYQESNDVHIKEETKRSTSCSIRQ